MERLWCGVRCVVCRVSCVLLWCRVCPRSVGAFRTSTRGVVLDAHSETPRCVVVASLFVVVDTSACRCRGRCRNVVV